MRKALGTNTNQNIKRIITTPYNKTILNTSLPIAFQKVNESGQVKPSSNQKKSVGGKIKLTNLNIKKDESEKMVLNHSNENPYSKISTRYLHSKLQSRQNPALQKNYKNKNYSFRRYFIKTKESRNRNLNNLVHTVTNNQRVMSLPKKNQDSSSSSDSSQKIPTALINTALNGSLVNPNGSSFGKCSLAAKNVVSIKASARELSPITKVVDDQLKKMSKHKNRGFEFSFSILSKVEADFKISKRGPEDFMIGKTIGKGAYAYVNVAIHKESRKKMALKIYDKVKLNTAQRIRGVINEVTILSKLNHQNIVKLYEAFETETNLVLAEEFIGGTSLLDLLKSMPDRRLEEEEARDLFKEMVEAVYFLHSQGIAHRDLKLENVLLDENWRVKLIDFGFSTWLGPTKKICIFCGTPSYMAPEIILKIDHLGQLADVWAMGVLLYAMMNGCFPFKGDNDNELYSRIVTGRYSFPYRISEHIMSLISRMLVVDPDERMSMKEVRNDPWVTGKVPIYEPNRSFTLKRPLSCRKVTKIELKKRGFKK